MAFELTSKDIQHNKRLPHAQVLDGMGYKGGNQSPHLAWKGAPEGTRSFVVTCYDPDAPAGSGSWHWVIANIAENVSELPTGAGSTGGTLPGGALQTRTDFGSPGYGGTGDAAPPPGRDHRYIFTVHASKVDKLEVGADASAAMVGFLTHMNSLGKAEIVTRFGGA
jgi:Raf kinase inhibitor-like YbhB/YbcL family protein